MMKNLSQALALLMVLEGILPFINPKIWRQWMAKVQAQSNEALSMMGLMSMLTGVVILYLCKA